MLEEKHNIGIDIGGSHIRLALITNFNILDFEERYILKEDKETEENIILFIKNNIKKMYLNILNKNNLSEEDINKIGIALPGICKDGIIYNAKNLNIKKYDILNDLKKDIFKEKKVNILNDSLASIKAEQIKTLKEIQNGIYLSLGTGIGGRVIQNGKILNEAEFEIGHTTFIYNGINCSCGKKGCLEKYCSMRALRKNIEKSIGYKEHIDLNNIDYTDEKVLKVIDEYINMLSSALASFIEIFELDKIVLGGSFSEIENEYMLSKLKEKLNSIPRISIRKTPKIEKSYYKNNSALIGSLI